MNHKLYYTVQKETVVLDPNHGEEILTGWKTHCCLPNNK